MTKCKECGEKISTKAEACPHCGAKQPKKTSATTWIIIIGVIIVYSVSNMGDVKPVEEPVKPKITKQQIEAQNRKKEQELLAELKTIPAGEIYTNKNKYSELNSMFPNNAKYKEKLSHYSQKVAELESRIGKKPQRSGWDGVPYEIKKYVERSAKDPESVDFEGCSDPRYNDIGWHTQCVFRANNSFGAKVLERWSFTMVRGQIVAANSVR